MNDRFIWHEGELEKVTKEELEKMGYISYSHNDGQHVCQMCSQNSFCEHRCDKYFSFADNIAKVIFEKYFNDDTANVDLLKKISDNLIAEIKAVLPSGITLTKGLFICSKIRLITLVQDETLIDVPIELKNNLLYGN